MNDPRIGHIEGRTGPDRSDTPLAHRLIERIDGSGPMTIAEYMATCLTDPQHGYYMNRDPIGLSGDFVTAPEITQIFGELLGVWCLSVWLELGSPAHFVLAELGPGRGTLMADVLRAADIRPAFLEAAEITLLEISPAFRAAQRRALGAQADVRWIDQVDDLPSGPLILVANEFFDALPIRQFVRVESGWAERLVGISERGELAFELGPVLDLNVDMRSAGQWLGIGAIRELRPAADAICDAIAMRIFRDGGAALMVDYGYDEPGFGDTFQALFDRKYDEPLAHPGEADLTAHVDFAALGAVASAAGAVARPVIDQTTLLSRLGIGDRAAKLTDGKDAATQAAISQAVARLIGEDGMGRLFKALAISSTGIELPAFDR